jgi:TPR repeat protein
VPKKRYPVAVKAAAAAILFLSLCAPALADLAAGQQALKNGDYATALNEFLPLANNGNAAAQSELGFLYEAGHGVPKDYTEAAQWFRLAADHGDAFAQTGLAFLYDDGEGVPKDYTEAAKLLRLCKRHLK